MRVLLFGKDGQLGCELLPALSQIGEVVALGRSDADFERPESLRQVVETAAPDVIVNAAAYTAVDLAEAEPARAHLVNHVAVGVLGRIAAARGALIVHYSTDYVFDGRKRAAYVETDGPNPLGVYGRTKLAGERELEAAGGRHLIVRTSWVHGRRGRNFVRTMLNLATERDALRVVADQFGAPTSARLVAEVSARLIAAAVAQTVPAGIFHLAAAGETSWHGLAQLVLAEARSRGMVLRAGPDDVTAIAAADYPTAAQRPANSRLDTARLRTALSMELPPWETGVRDSVAALVRELA